MKDDLSTFAPCFADPRQRLAKRIRSLCKPIMRVRLRAMNGNIEVVKQHLAAGADVNIKDDNWGATPLHFAARNGHKDVAELLVVKGAAMSIKDDDGRTPLHMVADIGHNGIAELLIAKGADVNAKDKRDYTPLDGAKNKPETAGLLRKHGGKTGAELKTEGR